MGKIFFHGDLLTIGKGKMVFQRIKTCFQLSAKKGFHPSKKNITDWPKKKPLQQELS